jgi:hypothetical protein
MRIPMISLAAAGAVALGGCAYGYGDYGYGLGYGDYYSPYGYGSSYGYGSPYGYGNPYFGLGSYYGWYDDYYYPGTGYYVYDTYRRPRIWTSTQRNYWVSRRPAVTTTTRTVVRPNWSAFNRRTTAQANRQAREEGREIRHSRRGP